MRLRPRMRSLAGLSLLVAVQSHAETYISCPGWFQDWYLRDASEPIATIRATVDFVNLNQGSYYGVYPADNDWNVFLNPDVGRYAINSFGDKNQAMESDGHRIRRGRIEGEVLALPRPMWFRDRFPPGTRVRAQGWWTMDSGHDDKTELHPLEWIMSIQENPFQLFAAVDESGRFSTADNGQFDTWAFIAPLSNEQVSPGQLSPGLTHIFAETAEVGSGGTARLRQTPGLINLDVELEPQPFLGPPHMGCGDSAGLSITHGSTYLAELSYATAPLLSDQVSFSIVTEQGKKFGKFRVVATLADPPLGTLRYSEWQHTRVFGFDPLTEVVRTSPQSHGVDVTWDYRPAEGSDERSFDLYVMGSTHAKNAWLTGDYRRIFVQANRRYTFPASTISLDRSEKKADSIGCPEYQSYTINFSDILPDVRVTEITWKARKVRDRAGTEVLGVYSTVAPGSPYVDADLRVGTYPVPNTARADITFTPADASNLAQVEIVADATTELGEHAQATTIARARCGIAGYSWEQIFEYIDRLRRSLHFRGEFEEWHENASRRDRKWIDAFLTWAGGRHPLSREQEQVLLEAVKRGERLPQVNLNDSLPQNPRRLRKPQTPIDLGELPARDEPKKP